jgi:hypothetical protein
MHYSMVRSKSVTFLCVTCGFAAAVVACADDGPALPEGCGAIDAGGCPGKSLAACADEACDFVASCSAQTGRWVQLATCPLRVREAGVDARPSDDGAPSPLDGGAAVGCLPLQLPDCSEATRAACGAGCCGCEDVFRCEGGDWAYLGPCTP